MGVEKTTGLVTREPAKMPSGIVGLFHAVFTLIWSHALEGPLDCHSGHIRQLGDLAQ